ncbi:twin-arginine translocase subunit TatB [Tianweitania sp. BSSL-BM11]|uniref:Sec-independent protein translocase protein TatB n=1 Tax=Tianweitania aestuarii TaxID=2814886 RepID=A0ABS5RWU1_9HYPH|nr:Sec-independent protein translocase protein TatB [Tianweitania aestuarii]MBS9720674.1 twin-arginine translocase subunit TatB [Tianweitania aestuarii]
MFDIGWTEMLVIAVVMIVVVGPKDLPRMLRTFGKFTAKMTSMAGDFRKQFDDALKEAELDDVRKSVNDLRSLNPKNEIRKALNPLEKAAADVRAGMDQVMRPSTPAPSTPASTEATAVEPLKTGATAAPSALTGEAPKEASGLGAGALAQPVEPLAPVAPVAPAAPLAQTNAVTAEPAKAPVAETAAPAKKARAPRAPKAAVAEGSEAPKTKAAPKKSAAEASTMNGTAAEKPVRTRKPKETGTAT